MFGLTIAKSRHNGVWNFKSCIEYPWVSHRADEDIHYFVCLQVMWHLQVCLQLPQPDLSSHIFTSNTLFGFQNKILLLFKRRVFQTQIRIKIPWSIVINLTSSDSTYWILCFCQKVSTNDKDRVAGKSQTAINFLSFPPTYSVFLQGIICIKSNS